MLVVRDLQHSGVLAGAGGLLVDSVQLDEYVYSIQPHLQQLEANVTTHKECFFLVVRRQIQHMIKYRYVPFSFGKARYGSN